MLPGSALDHLRPTLPATEKLGPAMRALNSRQRIFVTILWEQQPVSATEAYIRSGYNSTTRQSAQTASSALLQDDRIKAAIIEYGRAYAAAFAPELHGILMGMARNPQQPAVQAKAALAMFKHAGFVEQIEQKMTIDINITRQEKIQTLREAMRLEGRTEAEIDAMLGTPAAHEVIEGEFTEVEEDPFADVEY